MTVPVCPLDNILVELEKTFEDEVIFESGVRLYKDTTFHPEQHTTITGRVISVPNRLSRKPEMTGIVPEAEVGQTIIFSYIVVLDWLQRDNDTAIHYNQFFHEGKAYWKVSYDMVLGYIKEGQVIPASGYVFLKPLEEKPLTSSIILLDQNLSGDQQKKIRQGVAEVVSVGTPKRGEPPLSLKPGELAEFNQRFVQEYQILGKTYWILPHYYIQCKQAA